MKKRIMAAAAVLALVLTTACTKDAEPLTQTDEQTEQTIQTEQTTEDAAQPTQETADAAAADTAEAGAAQTAEAAHGSANDAKETLANAQVTPTEFTEEDIAAAHEFIEKMIQPDEPFDIATESPERIINLAYNWQKLIYDGAVADDTYHEDNMLYSADINMFTPETLGKIIRERLAPDFNISSAAAAELEQSYFWSWEEESGMFKGVDFFLPEGYTEPFRYIVSEEQQGDYYIINAIMVRGDVLYNGGPFRERDIEVYADAENCRYVFRKLPSGRVAPLSMAYTKRDPQDAKAAETALKTAKIKERIENDDSLSYFSGDYYYITDIDGDGKNDLVVTGHTTDGPSSTVSAIYSDFDIDSEKVYIGSLLLSPNGVIWYENRYQGGMGVAQITFTNTSTGEYFREEMGGGFGDFEAYHRYYVNSEDNEVTEEEYNAALTAAGGNDLKDFEFKYDITEYLINNSEYTWLDFVEFCRDNLT